MKTTADKTSIINVHPHILRHSYGFYLANKVCDLRLIQYYLGHRDPKHAVNYTRVVGSRFENLLK
ncbi:MULTISPECIES: tyrosine-type recombinase/integrase [Tenacibaculum]|uniref:tyrosine-type recombinase/integrase n=1 Tax=Tenacibaculum TaxID=104267 RepID=UPI00350FA28F